LVDQQRNFDDNSTSDNHLTDKHTNMQNITLNNENHEVTINGIRFNHALRAGIRRVISKKEYLNKINVFPVPDGDTGTNMAFTLNAIRQRLKKIKEEHIGKTLTQVADSAIDGARGNSGAILAQFFQGLSDGAAEVKKMTLQSFSQAVTTGATYARSAMSEPKEGTILTVVQDFAKAVENKVKDVSSQTKASDFVALLEHGLEKAKVSLAETPQKLEILKKSGVVDAGAQGFVELIEGITDFMRSGSVEDLQKPLELDFSEEEANLDYVMDGDIEFRFCTECVILGSDEKQIDHKALREQLNAIGNSVVVAGSIKKTKVHIHTNEPNDVFKLAESFGELKGQKADDMQQQANTAHQTSQDVIIVTDSAADIPEDLIDDLNIHVVPLRVQFGEKTYLDKVSLSSKEFYEELVRNPNHPQTSQPTPGDFRRQFEYLASHFNDVIAINVTGKASGTFQSAELASTRIQAHGKVHTVDSRSASTGQGMIVVRAAEMAKAGKSAKEILSALEQIILTSKVYAYLGDIAYGVKGGRVPKSKKVLADLLRLNPILTAMEDGTVTTGGAFFGKARRPQKFVKFLKKKMHSEKKYRVFVSHANLVSEGEAVMELLRVLPNVTAIDFTETGTAIGAHGGPGTVVVGLQEIL